MNFSLPDRWRAEADVLDRRGAPQQAAVLRSCAEELEAYVREQALALLTLHEAAAESGFTRSAIEKQIQRGDIVNFGESGSPRVRRADLGRKPNRSTDDLDDWGNALVAARLDAS